jgi:DNA-binding NarL/FixJ family response regulator
VPIGGSKFALVEDQVMFRTWLRQLLVEDCNGTVVLEAGTLAELRAHLDVVRGVDLLILDIRLPDGDGVDFLDDMTIARISAPVLLVSSSCEDYIVHRVSRSFVQGFVHKDEEPKVLLTAIQMITAGGAFFSPRFVKRQRELAQDPGNFETAFRTRARAAPPDRRGSYRRGGGGDAGARRCNGDNPQAKCDVEARCAHRGRAAGVCAEVRVYDDQPAALAGTESG